MSKKEDLKVVFDFIADFLREEMVEPIIKETVEPIIKETATPIKDTPVKEENRLIKQLKKEGEHITDLMTKLDKIKTIDTNIRPIVRPLDEEIRTYEQTVFDVDMRNVQTNRINSVEDRCIPPTSNE